MNIEFLSAPSTNRPDSVNYIGHISFNSSTLNVRIALTYVLDHMLQHVIRSVRVLLSLVVLQPLLTDVSIPKCINLKWYY